MLADVDVDDDDAVAVVVIDVVGVVVGSTSSILRDLTNAELSKMAAGWLLNRFTINTVSPIIIVDATTGPPCLHSDTKESARVSIQWFLSRASTSINMQMA